MDSLKTPAFACIALSLILIPACGKPDPIPHGRAQDALTPNADDGEPPANKPSPTAADDASGPGSNRVIRSSDLERYAYVMSKASISCNDAERALDCSMGNPNNGDLFEASLYHGCGEAGVFGGVIADSNAYLYDKYPPKAGAWPASLERSQFVCVLAEAGSADEAYFYYVVETPTESVMDCATSDLCKSYGNRSVTWHVPTSNKPCRAVGPNTFEGTCAMGWIEAEKIELFSMGLLPEPDYRPTKDDAQ